MFNEMLSVIVLTLGFCFAMLSLCFSYKAKTTDGATGFGITALASLLVTFFTIASIIKNWP
jgi:hypothetical protein